MRQGQRAKGRRAQRDGADRSERHDIRDTARNRDNGSYLFNTFGAQPQAMGAWADVTQNAMRDFVAMWSGAARESLRLATELQQAQVDAARDLGRIFTQSAERMRRVA